MIKLKQLHIKTKFKNIENLIINFERSNRIAVFIGNNASGKSNILEAISAIFAGLYDKKMNPSFSYALEYEKDGKDISIEYSKTTQKYSKFNSEDLPSKVIAIYSGEEKRLWNTYYCDYGEKFLQHIINGKEEFLKNLNMQYINKYHWHISLLILYAFGIKTDDILKASNINDILFYFSKSNIENMGRYKENNVIKFTSELYRNYTNQLIGEARLILEDIKEIINKKNYSKEDLFKILTLSLLPRDEKYKLIDKIELNFEGGIELGHLSEGQKKQILIKCATQIIADENSILLLDEPDSHIHISNQSKIKDLLFDSQNKPHVQTILTTHSPILSNCFTDDNIYMLSRKDDTVIIEDINKQKAFSHLCNGILNSHEQNQLLGSTKPLILLVEGKHDKEHITNAYHKLKEEDNGKYKNLDFDIFAMDGANNISHLLNGLKTRQEKFNKIFIGIFDDDKEGQNARSDTNCKYPENKSCVDIYSIFYPRYGKYESQNKKSEFELENLFNHNIIKYYYEQAILNDKLYDFKSIHDEFKNILYQNSKNFQKEDFANFRNLFDLILEIYNKSKVTTQTKKEEYKISDNKTAVVAQNNNNNPENPELNIFEKIEEVSKNIKTTLKNRNDDVTNFLENQKKESIHFENKPENIRNLYAEYKSRILKLDSDIKMNAQNIYIAFQKNKNFVSFEIKKNDITLTINMPIGNLIDDKKIARDVSKIGHRGSGDYQITISNEDNIDYIMELIQQSINYNQ